MRARTARRTPLRYSCRVSGVVPDLETIPCPLALSVRLQVFGVALAILGVSEFQRIHGMEEAGHVAGLSWRVNFLYTHLGKWGVFGAFELLGMSFLIAAIDKTRAALRLA